MLPKQKRYDNKTNPNIEYNNFMNSTNNNNNSQKQGDHKTLERIQNQSVQFNSEQQFDSIACNVAVANVQNTSASNNCEYITGCNCKRTNDPRVIENAYENLQAYELSLSKKFLLDRYFRSDARTQAIYENLCRGCGYGVFTSQGDLCNFCECIVNGVHSSKLCENSNANIYENICESCSRIFNTPECSCNESRVRTQLISDLDDSNKQQQQQEIEQKSETKKIKLSKSKSFGKRDKRSIFHSLFGTLRGVQRTNSETAKHSYKNGVSIKPLEIVHHVDGHDNVFRTQETFDLQRICELKRTQTSCSDQHIYGRLKSNEALAATAATATAHCSNTLPTQLTHTEEQLVNQSISIDNFKPKKQAKPAKRPRISKTRLLRTKSQNDALDTLPMPVSTTQSNQSLYLNESICNWMSSLRQNIHYYEDNINLCFPKSIPPKSNIYCYSTADSVLYKPSSILSKTAPVDLVTNCQNIDKLTVPSDKSQQDIRYSDVTLQSSSSESYASDDFSTVTLRRTKQQQQQQQQQKQQQEVFAEQTNSVQQVAAAAAEFDIEQIILEFKRQLIDKQMQNQQQQQQNSNDFAYTKVLNSQQQQQQQLKQITRAQPNLRSKRQAIYLKIDDTLSNANVIESTAIREPDTATTKTNASTNNNNNNNNNNNVNNREKETNSQSTNENLSQLVSRSTIHQVITTVASKRCGYYDLNSDFVNDILNAFDTFLLRNDDDQLETEILVDEKNKSEIKSVAFNNNEEEHISDESVNSNTETTESFIDNVNSVVVVPCALNPENACVTENSLIYSSKDNLGSIVVPSHTATSTCFDSCALLALNTTTADTAKIAALDKKVPECEQIFDLFELINQQLLSFGLHRAILYNDKYLSVFLCAIRNTECYRFKYARYNFERLLKIYQRFYAFCHASQQSHSIVQFKTIGTETGSGSASEFEIVNATTASALGVIEQSSDIASVCLSDEKLENKNKLENQSANQTTATITQLEVNVMQEDIRTENCVNEFKDTNASVFSECNSRKVRPKVPQRDPKTILSRVKQLTPPQLPAKKLESHIQQSIPNMTKPTINLNPTTDTATATATATSAATDTDTATTTTTNSMQKLNSDEEGIYQTIWQFKTVGEVRERYETDADYYEINTNTKAAVKSLHINDDDSSATIYDVEDHGEWETDDEFMFTTEFECDTQKALSSNATNEMCNSTIRSTHSSSSVTGSTVTGFGSSTTTLASVISISLKHHLFRSVGIFYSLTEPKLRAIIYDYERNHASTYFAKPTTITAYSSNDINANDSGLGKSPVPPPRTTSARNNDKNNLNALSPLQPSESASLQSLNKLPAATPAPAPAMPSKFQLLPDSVLAWQFMLLDVHYLEDEEDMIVAESEILRAQEIKDDIDTRQTQQLNILQRFKSASIGNLIDLPNDDDKKSIKERMRNKLQRGVFKLNVRSPKSEKKSRGIFRRAEATSLYLEDGMKPKYPIFGAPLEQLELNQTTQPNVPRFVVDCIDYIERKDCIEQDGLYRASGNKVSVDELKQKLSESYIYDPKLLIIDDIHTLTSLLKQFFRELGAPLIPQTTYERLGHQLTDSKSIETMRIAFDEINEPNRSTLKFLIKHLTNVAAHSSSNRMPASNLAIVWGPCLLSANQIEFDIGRMNTLAKVLIENYERIFASNDNERLVS